MKSADTLHPLLRVRESGNTNNRAEQKAKEFISELELYGLNVHKINN
jgi:hypothetical protein